MYCVKKVTEDLTWVGSNDRRLALFEGVYQVPRGVSYNSYLLTDEKTVLLDTVDKSVTRVFFENLAHVLGGRKLDYLIVHHMEPDHSAAIEEVLLHYPEVTVLCNQKTAKMMARFVAAPLEQRLKVVAQGETLCTGRHTLTFVDAPMVHWPEVMMSYDLTDKILFSADAFGTFGAINGAMFADEVDFERDYLDEARRYYTNIVGKYGTQVQAILKKASGLDIQMICPLHGFVWRKNLGDFIAKYQLWSTYTPEVDGVLIAYASVYGGTENAAEILACRLRDLGIRTVMFDVSVTPASEIVAAAFQYSHLVFAAPTYNAGIFVTMENLLHDLVAHNLQNRTVALIENGSWAPTSGKLMRELLSKLKQMTFLDGPLTVPSTVQDPAGLEALAGQLAATVKRPSACTPRNVETDPAALFRLTYGLFVLSAKKGQTSSGCIVNTVVQISENPNRVAFSVNKANLTGELLGKDGRFTISVLDQSTPMELIRHFGFQSGRTVDKYDGWADSAPAGNGVLYLTQCVNAVLAGRVVSSADWGSHILFIGELTEAKVLSDLPSLSYQYYQDHVKPKPPLPDGEKKGFVCKTCGYVYEGDTLPADFICPLCKHGAEDFVPLG